MKKEIVAILESCIGFMPTIFGTVICYHMLNIVRISTEFATFEQLLLVCLCTIILMLSMLVSFGLFAIIERHKRN